MKGMKHNMKKKYIFILLLSLLLTFINITSIYADNQYTGDAKIILDGIDHINKNDTTYTLHIKIDELSGVEEGNVAGFEAILNYDENIFEKVNITGQNGWDVTYSEDTKKMVGLVDNISANKNIASIEFKLKENLNIDTSTNITITQLSISDDIHLNKSIENISKEVSIGNYNTNNTITTNSNDKNQKVFTINNLKNILIVIFTILAIIFIVTIILKLKKNKKK